MQTAVQKSGYGISGWVGRHINRKRLLTLILDHQKSGKFHIAVKGVATVDAFVDM